MRFEQLVDYKQLAKFLAEMNAHQEHHIGYCGNSAEEIERILHADFSENAFIVAKLDGKVVGAIGLDISEDNSAEVWGPFIKKSEDALPIIDAMWQRLMILQSKIEIFQFFINEENDIAKAFITSLHCEYKGQHLVLLNKKENFKGAPLLEIVPYEARYFESFKMLHNTAFPNTYYSADDIVKRLNTQNELFVLPSNIGTIKGYVYVEIDKEYNEASIEYIAISQNFLRQGLGTELLKVALDCIFNVHNIEKVQLCVSNDNEIAINLYKAVGFEVQHYLDCYLFRKV